ncbi:MAG: hypothetical protein KKB82_07170 [Candidatus Omnitrophica bacterium]|nr:hypothetical protein [Candidatus Omnitrophota bacterium]MBU1925683.1 hypothetical protein [Candidatus Omnitrophota bacterium]
MKKRFKRNSSSAPPQAEQDVVALINKIQQQLVFLEKKIDTLISQSSERPFREKHFSKPFQRFDRSHQYGEGKQDHRPRERSFTQAICADCNKECEVPFKPSGDRPVYCRECFSKRKKGSSFKEKYATHPGERDFTQAPHFDKQPGGKTRRSEKKNRPISRRRK